MYFATQLREEHLTIRDLLSLGEEYHVAIVRDDFGKDQFIATTEHQLQLLDFVRACRMLEIHFITKVEPSVVKRKWHQIKFYYHC